MISRGIATPAIVFKKEKESRSDSPSSELPSSRNEGLIDTNSERDLLSHGGDWFVHPSLRAPQAYSGKRNRNLGEEHGILNIQNLRGFRGEIFPPSIESTGMLIGDLARLATIFNHHEETID